MQWASEYALAAVLHHMCHAEAAAPEGPSRRYYHASWPFFVGFLFFAGIGVRTALPTPAAALQL